MAQYKALGPSLSTENTLRMVACTEICQTYLYISFEAPALPTNQQLFDRDSVSRSVSVLENLGMKVTRVLKLITVPTEMVFRDKWEHFCDTDQHLCFSPEPLGRERK